MRLGPIHILVIVVAVGLTGCESDAELIRNLNQDPTTLSAEIDAVDIEEGDCINSTLPEDVDIESVVIVPCSGSWHYRAVGSFNVANGDQYPGDEYFDRQAYERCDARYTFLLIPLDESWDLGNREVTCLQDSFGLSTSDPAKLDRLVRFEGLNVGDCFNEAAETDGLLVERVDCSGAWESRVEGRFSVSLNDEYPGEAYLQAQATLECGSSSNYYYYGPSPESWALGHRTVMCIKSS